MRPLTCCWATLGSATFAELVDAAGGAGFDAITVRPDQYRMAVSEVGARRVKDLLNANAVRVTAVEALVSALPGSPSAESVDPARRDLFRATADECFRMATQLGAPTVVVAPYLGGWVPRDVMVESLAALARRAGREGLTLSLEFLPMSGIPSIGAAIDLIDAAEEDNLGLTLDVFHLATSADGEGDLNGLTEGVVTQLQLADVPEDGTGAGPRALPGTGVLPLAQWAQCVLANSPDAAVGIEVINDTLDLEPPDEVARQAMAAMQGLSDVLGGGPGH